MSQLQRSLEILGFKDMIEVTEESLKKAFKMTVLKSHPDKGGSAEEFDHLLSAYLYLVETVNRIHGGRNTLVEMESPKELKESRMDEIINKIFDEFERDAFNQEFEKQHPRMDHGYRDWLHDETEDNNVTDGEYGSATQKPPTFEASVLQAEFEHQNKIGKPTPSALILHPEEMAYSSGGMMGTAIIESSQGPYTSSIFADPEYTDVYSAFTKDNTICDKVSAFVESSKTFEQILAERQQYITPLADKELEAIAEFEKKKRQEEQDHLRNVKDYFEHGSSGGLLDTWPPSSYPSRDHCKASKGFVIEL